MLLSREGLLSRIHLKSKGNKQGNQLFFYTYSRDAIYDILKISGIDYDDEIILPDYICSTVIEVILQITKKIKFYNINDELEYSENEIESLISKKTKLIFFVDYFGIQTLVSKKLESQLKKQNILIIKDAAHSFLTILNNNYAKDYDYDYLISSIYKNIPIQVGSIAIGDFKNKKNFINLFILIKRFLVLFIKNLIYLLGLQKFLNAELYNIKVSSTEYKNSSYGINAYRIYSFLFKHIDFEKIIKERQDLINQFDTFIRGNTSFTPMIKAYSIEMNILQGYPLIFKCKHERDSLLKTMIDNKIDAYTWPTFHSININKALWDRVLILPIDKRVIKVISNV